MFNKSTLQSLAGVSSKTTVQPLSRFFKKEVWDSHVYDAQLVCDIANRDIENAYLMAQIPDMQRIEENKETMSKVAETLDTQLIENNEEIMGKIIETLDTQLIKTNKETMSKRITDALYNPDKNDNSCR